MHTINNNQKKATCNFLSSLLETMPRLSIARLGDIDNVIGSAWLHIDGDTASKKLHRPKAWIDLSGEGGRGVGTRRQQASNFCMLDSVSLSSADESRDAASKAQKRSREDVEASESGMSVPPLAVMPLEKKRLRARQYIHEALYPAWLAEYNEGLTKAQRKEQAKKFAAFQLQLDLEASPIVRRLRKRPRISAHTLVDDVLASNKVMRDIREGSLVIPKTYELFDNSIYRSVVGRGDVCMAMIRKTLDEFGFKRHSNQIYFHEQMMRACLRKIYQFDFEQNIDRVLKENGWPKMVQEVLVITARRMGKTTASAMFSAALIISVPKMELMIFSVSLNSSRKMLQMIKDFIDNHPVGKTLPKSTVNKDKLWFECGPGDRRTCESRPGRGNVSTLQRKMCPHTFCIGFLYYRIRLSMSKSCKSGSHTSPLPGSPPAASLGTMVATAASFSSGKSIPYTFRCHAPCAAAIIFRVGVTPRMRANSKMDTALVVRTMPATAHEAKPKPLEASSSRL